MNPQETVEAILAELYRQIGHGRLGRLQQALNVGKNFFSYWKGHPASARLLPLAEALEYLEIEPADFFAAVFHPDDSPVAEPSPNGSDGSTWLEALANSLEPISEPGSFFATAATLPSGAPPIGVQKAVRRLEEPSARGEGSPPGTQAEEIIDRQELARLDEFRWDNPRKANLMLERAISGSPMELLAEILLVYGTTFRQLDCLGDARWAYLAGEIRAKKTNERDILATILQRRSWVEFAEGNFSGSLDLLRRAAGTFAELGESNRQAKTLVSMALQYADLEKFGEAVICADSALRQLNEDEKHHRFSAHQVRALAYSRFGDTAAVLRNLEAARALLSHCPKAAKVRFVWLEARLKKDILPLETAAHIFEEAASFFAEIGEIQASALAMLEFVNCLVALDKHPELMQVAEALSSFAFEVDDSRESGRLSAAALMEVYREILKVAASDTISSVAQAIQRAVGALEAPTAVEV